MGYFVERHWLAESSSGLPRRERRGGVYRAYMPDLLAERTFDLTGPVAADVADAEASIRRLDSTSGALSDTEALARILLRAESVASSHIEGLSLRPRRLLRADAARAIGAPIADVTAEEVLGNIDAMRTAVDAALAPGPITVETILSIHRCLLRDARSRAHAGRIHEEQNWVGGNEYNPLAASYVPPPPEEVPRLLDDLARFCNTDMLPAVVQAAVVHAQFETIHPFADGNGRAGRALLHMILARRGLAAHVQPPVSLVMAARAKDYIAGLTAFRFEGSSDSATGKEGFNTCVEGFAAACVSAVEQATAFEQRCEAIQAAWRHRTGRIRSGSSVDLLLRRLPGTPILSVKTAMDLLGRSKPQVNAAVARLEEAGVLRPLTVGRRNRAFEAREIIDAFADLETGLVTRATQ